MRIKTVFIIGAFFLSIVFLTSTANAALGKPTCVSPKVGYGQIGTYYAPRTPTFSWTPVTYATWYQIWVSEAATPHTAHILQWVENGTSWTPDRHPALSPGTKYSWWIRAWNKTDGRGPWSAKADFTAGNTTYMSINANDFVPYEDGYDYVRYYGGGGLTPNNSTSNEWCAPVNFPHLAKVISVGFYYHNNGAVGTASRCWLYRSLSNSLNREEMGTVIAGTGDGADSAYDISISNDRIYNHLCSYFLRVYLPSASNRLIHVRIYYWE